MQTYIYIIYDDYLDEIVDQEFYDSKEEADRMCIFYNDHNFGNEGDSDRFVVDVLRNSNSWDSGH